jgi:PPOX class probable FMN-dependent enzyme
MEIRHRIESVDQLAALYRQPGQRAVDKQVDRLDETMIEFVARSPFCVLATTNGAGSVDASPRGGPPGFVRVLDDRHVALPDLNGNNRLDSYRNVVEHPHVGLLVIVPGKDETLRINGPAVLTTDPDLLAGFTSELRTPTMALVVETAEVYGHCAKAFRRGKVWEPAAWPTFDGAPDLARMYAAVWGYDETKMRDLLETTYVDDLSRD